MERLLRVRVIPQRLSVSQLAGDGGKWVDLWRSGSVCLQAGSSVAGAANRGAGCFVPLQ